MSDQPDESGSAEAATNVVSIGNGIGLAKGARKAPRIPAPAAGKPEATVNVELDPDSSVGELIAVAKSALASSEPAQVQPDGSETTGDEATVPAAVVDKLRNELFQVLADVEFRLAQQYELMRRQETGGFQKLYVEDLVDTRHRITGYQLLSNSNGTAATNGSIAWKDVHVVLLGVDYTIANGTTPNKYAWFVKPATYTAGTQVTLQTGNSVPTLGQNDALLFVNNGGVAVSALESSIAAAVAPGTVGNDQLLGGIDQTKISGLANALADINGGINNAIAIAEGAISQHFGANFPWPDGSTTQPNSAVGDVYTVQGSTNPALTNGTSYRWSGSAGNPANKWILIEDAALTKALADAAAARGIAEGKTTTHYANLATPPAALAIGDEWVVLDKGNMRKRATALGTTGWVDLLIGNDGINTIDGSKLTGTVNAARVGAGVNGVNLSSGTGSVSTARLNTAFHMLY